MNWTVELDSRLPALRRGRRKLVQIANELQSVSKPRASAPRLIGSAAAALAPGCFRQSGNWFYVSWTPTGVFATCSFVSYRRPLHSPDFWPPGVFPRGPSDRARAIRPATCGSRRERRPADWRPAVGCAPSRWAVTNWPEVKPWFDVPAPGSDRRSSVPDRGPRTNDRSCCVHTGGGCGSRRRVQCGKQVSRFSASTTAVAANGESRTAWAATRHSNQVASRGQLKSSMPTFPSPSFPRTNDSRPL